MADYYSLPAAGSSRKARTSLTRVQCDLLGILLLALFLLIMSVSVWNQSLCNLQQHTPLYRHGTNHMSDAPPITRSLLVADSSSNNDTANSYLEVEEETDAPLPANDTESSSENGTAISHQGENNASNAPPSNKSESSESNASKPPLGKKSESSFHTVISQNEGKEESDAPPPAKNAESSSKNGSAVSQQGENNASNPPLKKKSESSSNTNISVSEKRARKKVVEFIPFEDLDIDDVFAASWWQTMKRFDKLDIKNIRTVEDDAFAPIYSVGDGLKVDVRMARDWLDFSVEHLSKWWKTMGTRGEIYAMGKLQSYVQRVMHAEKESNLMASTLAVIPYGVNSKSTSSQQLWMNSLAATIASLLQHGVGRVLVVGHYKADYKLALEAFELLLRYHEKDDSHRMLLKGKRSFSAIYGSTELAFVTTKNVKSQYIQVNVPKGALAGLQQAIRGERKDAEKWIGKSPNRFKYVFLTESDQILNARLSPHFLKTMDKGGIIAPHRLQPVPHPLDVQGLGLKSHEMLPAKKFPTKSVHELDEFDSCCDTTNRTELPSCGIFWWFCGFDVGTDTGHERLYSYEFMRLAKGTGIVHLAANEHSRKCIPTKKSNGSC